MKPSEPVEDARLATVERELRSLKRAVVAATLGAAVVASLTAAGQAPERIADAEKLVLRDRRGNARATLSIEEPDGTATLAFLDEAGRARLRIGSGADGSTGLSLRAETGAPRLTMSATAAGEPAFALQDERGTPRLGFALSPEGSGFRLYDAEGRRRLVVGVAPRGVLLQFEDRDGRPRLSLALSEDADPRLLLTDGTGNELAALP
jgi:hypothetical protein